MTFPYRWRCWTCPAAGEAPTHDVAAARLIDHARTHPPTRTRDDLDLIQWGDRQQARRALRGAIR